MQSECDEMTKPLDYGPPIPVAQRRSVQRKLIGVLIALGLIAGSIVSVKEIGIYRQRRQRRLDDELRLAVEVGDVVRAGRLLDSGANVNAFNENSALLATAVQKRNEPMVKLLVSHGANPDAGTNTPLIYAISNDDLPMAEILVSAGAQTDHAACRGNPDSLLQEAVFYHREDAVEFLLRHHANPNRPGSWGFRPLHIAAMLGDARPIKPLVDAGAIVDATDDAAETPLDFAAWRNEDQIAGSLLACGAKPTVWSASAFGDLGALKELLRAGPYSPSDYLKQNRPGGSLLYLSALNGRRQVFTYLLSLGADISARNSDDERSILHAAAMGGDVEIARTLLADGLDVNVPDRTGEAPLHCAAIYGNLPVGRFLIERGAKLEAASEGATPLDEAIRYNRPAFVQFLLSQGAKPSPNALHEASQDADVTIVKLLLDAGLDPNARDERGWTPLHVAMDWGKNDTANLLLSRGADPNAKNKDGKTPADVGRDPEIGR